MGMTRRLLARVSQHLTSTCSSNEADFNITLHSRSFNTYGNFRHLLSLHQTIEMNFLQKVTVGGQVTRHRMA